MVHACRVPGTPRLLTEADEDRIKSKILQGLKSFDLVNEKVEQALWIFMIKLFRARKAKASSLFFPLLYFWIRSRLAVWFLYELHVQVSASRPLFSNRPSGFAKKKNILYEQNIKQIFVGEIT